MVTDERRCDGAKGARPEGVAAGSLSDRVASLVQATGPPCARFLPSNFLRQSRRSRLVGKRSYVGLLAIIVLIRTFLSFALETEIEGCWPWQRRERKDEASEGPPPVR